LLSHYYLSVVIIKGVVESFCNRLCLVLSFPSLSPPPPFSPFSFFPSYFLPLLSLSPFPSVSFHSLALPFPPTPLVAFLLLPFFSLNYLSLSLLSSLSLPLPLLCFASELIRRPYPYLNTPVSFFYPNIIDAFLLLSSGPSL